MLTRCNRAGAVACRSIRAEAIRCAVRDYVSERKKSASPSNPQSEAAKIAFKRTQSILLDEGNSIIHPEHYKLHKEFQDAQSEDDTTLSPNAMRWQSDPYRTPRACTKAPPLQTSDGVRMSYLAASTSIHARIADTAVHLEHPAHAQR